MNDMHHIIITLAWRNLWRNRRRTLIMLLAIVVGAWAMIFMSALMRGMVDQTLTDSIDNLPGHIQIHHPEFGDDPSVVNHIEQLNSVQRQALLDVGALHVSERLKLPAMISSEYESRGIQLLAIQPAKERAAHLASLTLVEGSFLSDVNDRGLVIGQSLAEKLNTRLNKRVVIMTQDPDNQIADRGMRITGIYKAQMRSQEELMVFASLGSIQQLLQLPGRVSEIVIEGEDYRTTDNLLANIKSAVAEAQTEQPLQPVSIESWSQLDLYLGSMLGIMDGFALVWMIVIFLALSFGLVNTLSMAIFERLREIGLVLALGMRPAAVLYQVLLESFFLLVMGLFSGTLLAIVTLYPLRGGIDLSAFAEALEMMGSSPVLVPSLLVRDIVTANIVVLVLGIATSLIPAIRATRYDPVEAINHN